MQLNQEIIATLLQFLDNGSENPLKTVSITALLFALLRSQSFRTMAWSAMKAHFRWLLVRHRRGVRNFKKHHPKICRTLARMEHMLGISCHYSLAVALGITAACVFLLPFFNGFDSTRGVIGSLLVSFVLMFYSLHNFFEGEAWKRKFQHLCSSPSPLQPR